MSLKVVVLMLKRILLLMKNNFDVVPLSRLRDIQKESFVLDL
jgi:hypothetical protein